MSNENSDEPNTSELNATVEKILAFRHGQRSDKDKKKLEINPKDISDGRDLSPSSVTFDPGLDEASYLSWVEKFKDASQATNNPVLELENRRSLTEERHLKAEAAKKKSKDKKLAKWEAPRYISLSVKDPVCPADMDIMSDSGSVQFVYGDCTQPSKVCPSEPTIIFSCVDDSGNWGHGRLFDALAKLSGSIPSAYEKASEVGDLHLGDLHLIEIAEDHNEQSKNGNTSQWVVLAVVQSYNLRRKVPRSNICMSDLEQCLSKASFSTAQNSGIFRILNLSESLCILFSTDLGNKSNNVHFLAFSMCISFKINNLWIFPTFFIYLNLLTLFL